MQALPVAVLLGGALAVAWRDSGSIAAADWLPWSVLAALALAVLLAAGAAALPSRTVVAGVVALALLGVWAFASLEWSPLPTLARDEGLLTLSYAVAVALPALALRSVEGRLAALWVAALAVGGSSLATGLELLAGPGPLARFDHGRLSFPIAYANAGAALCMLGFWPGVVLAARRQSHPLLRGAALAAAAASLGGALLPQSKGALLGLAVSTVAVFALAPGRLRVLVPFAVPAAGAAAAFGTLTAPFSERDAASVRAAGLALLLLTLGAGAAGVAYGYADRAFAPRERTVRLLSRALLAALVLALAAGVAAGAASIGSPTRFAQEKWRSFSHMPEHETASTHLLTLGSNRYDFWRVEAHQFAEHPLAGIGARGFGAAYLQHRRSADMPARGHSLVMDTLAEQGLVGFGLLAAALGLLLAAAARAVRARRATALAGLGAAVAWLTQACVDWTWTFPAVSVPALALLGVAVARDSAPVAARRAAPFAAVAAALALLVLAPPWLAARLTTQAVRSGDPSRLPLARRLDPVSTTPLLAAFQLAPDARSRLAPLREAARKEPRSAAVRYLLGVTEQAAGERAAARRDLQAALALDPGDPLILSALRAG